MIKKLTISLQVLFMIVMIIFVINTYFSEEIVEKINKNRILFSLDESKSNLNLPLLKNDTNNVINYVTNDNNQQKIKKRYFWNLLKDE